MKALVRFLLIFTCMKLIVSKPQHLQEQTQHHLDPLNEPEFEYPPKDPGKRTIGPLRHYALGKHVGIHPLGFRYVLGYSPINIKYVPVIKPVTVLKPVLHQNIRQLWRPVVAPTRQYLPPILHVPKPLHHIDHGWKPVAPPVKPVVPVVPPSVHEIQHVHSLVEQPIAKPIAVQPLLPAVPAPPLPVQPVAFKPLAPAHPLNNYFYFQTPVAKPALLPQLPFFHVTRPQLPVLPLGATFPAPVLQASSPGVIQVPSGPALPFPLPVHPAPPVAPAVHHPVAVPQPVHPVLPVHHPVAVHPQPAQPVLPVHHPVAVHPQPVHPVVPVHHPVTIHPQPAPPVVHHPVVIQPQPARPVLQPQPVLPGAPAVPVHPQFEALPPISVEFHGNRHLVPYNNQIPFTFVQPSVPLPKPQFTPVVLGRQPHALPLPPEVHTQLTPEIQHHVPEQPQVPSIHNQPPQVPTHFEPQAPFNPEAAVQPGQTDLQVPVHLPDHPYFRAHGVNHFQPAGNLEPPFPPFQNPGNVLRPSISLEPPLTHGQS